MLNLVSLATSTAELAHGEKSCTHSLTHSITQLWCPENRCACASEYMQVHRQTQKCRNCIHTSSVSKTWQQIFVRVCLVNVALVTGGQRRTMTTSTSPMSAMNEIVRRAWSIITSYSITASLNMASLHHLLNGLPTQNLSSYLPVHCSGYMDI